MIFYFLSDIYIFIDMKNKKVTIRLTTSQFERLTEQVIEEQISKSKYLRSLLDEKSKICRIPLEDKKSFQKTKNKLFDIIKRKK